MGERAAGSVIVRSLPKVVFLYPTFLAAILAGVWAWASLHAVHGDLDLTSLGPGRLFWWTFSINLLVISFDFGRGEFLALVLFFAAVVLGVVLLDQNVALVRPVQEALSTIQLQAHPHFYLLTAVTLGLVFVAVFVHGRFDYWEITSNELLHHHGLLGDVERFPAPELRLTKEITDVFEYVLLGAGRLVLHPQGAQRATVLENVPFVARKEEHIQRLLSSLAVTVQQPAAPPQEKP